MWALLLVVFAANSLLNERAKLVYLIFSNASRSWWSETSIYATFEGLDVYRYSPTFAVLLTPFAVLPDRVGVICWNILSVGALFTALHVLLRDVMPRAWPASRDGLFLFLVVVGTVRGVWTGQSNALLTACAIFAAAAVIQQRWWTAAFFLAGPVFIKIWPVALFMLLAWRWPRQLIGRFTAACGLFAVVPFLTRAPGVVVDEYVAFLDTLVRTSSIRWRGYSDAWTLLEPFGEVDAGLYRVLQLASATLVFGWCVWQSRRGLTIPHLVTLTLAVWVGWQLLFGPGTERLTYGLIAPFATWALLRSYGERRYRILTTLAWLMTGLLGTGWVGRKLVPIPPAWPLILPLGVVVFLIWLVVRETGPPAFRAEPPVDDP